MNSMGNRKNRDERPRRRFRKAVDGEIIRRNYRLMPTAELAQRLGLEPRQISDFVYRNNFEEWAGKDSAERSRAASANGRKGGRPKKKT